MAGTKPPRAGGANDAMRRALDIVAAIDGSGDEITGKGDGAIAIVAEAGGTAGTLGGRGDGVAGARLALCTGAGRARTVGVAIRGAAGGAISALVTDSDWRRICPSV